MLLGALVLRSCRILFLGIDLIVNLEAIENKSSIGDYTNLTPNNASSTMLVEHSNQIINLKAPVQFEKIRVKEDATLNPDRKLSQTSQINNIAGGKSPK